MRYLPPLPSSVWYNLVMWNKVSLWAASALLGPPAFPTLDGDAHVWLDAGCHAPMCGDHLRGTCLAARPTARWRPLDASQHGRLRIAQLEPLPDGLMAGALTPLQYVQAKHVHFAGTIFGAPRAAVARLADHFLDALQWMLSQVCRGRASRMDSPYLSPSHWAGRGGPGPGRLRLHARAPAARF